MNTTRKLIILILIAVMGLTATIPSTFSWFVRDRNRTGHKLAFNREELPISNGAVTLETKNYVTTNGMIERDTVTKLKKTNNDALVKSIGNAGIQYYKTTIKNDTSNDAYVDIYLNGVSNNTKFYAGTINPVINERQAGEPTRIKKANSETRIYFQCDQSTTGDNKWTDSSDPTKSYYLYYKLNGSWAYDTFQKGSGSSLYAQEGTSSTTVTTYYCDLAEGASSFFISQTTQNALTSGFKRTREFKSYTPSTLYYITGKKIIDSDGFAECLTAKMDDGLDVPSYYSEVTSGPRRSAYIPLPSGYTANSVSYATNASSSELTIDGSGKIRIKLSSVNSEVQKTVTTTATGPIGDTKEFTTTIKIPPTIDNFPLCRNVLVKHNSEEVVEWYVTNKLLSTSNTFSWTSMYTTL